ncbi:B-lymphocyte antigen CD20 isoform X1 [Ornithorhynchus anatinus]|uniref:B-lymphocyte antigen CD20 isoform X1 n=1 Tax=Ornithorhynchus anatinus TaxID=9258 RepID=UPI0010A76986|nr:B-lymphocyte antigen CD20 isoform X1 [Ornithorhynchus anatinus]
MMTPTGSVKGTGAVDSVKSTQVRQPSQRTVPRRASRSVGPTQSFFMREAKPLGAVQIMNGLIHIALGGILMVPLGVYAPICITIWYPLWGGIMFIISGSLLVAAENSPSNILAKAKVGMNVISLFSAITGIIILIMDVFNITISHFFKMESLYLAKTSMPYINIYSCEQSGISQQYCLGMRAAFLGILSVMLTFTFLQNFVVAGITENEWRGLCSTARTVEKRHGSLIRHGPVPFNPQADKMEQAVQLNNLPSQHSESEAETLPTLTAQEEDTEISFPEPPQ